jgi:hypothetical protein
MTSEEADENERVFLKDALALLDEYKREQPVKVAQYERGDLPS